MYVSSMSIVATPLQKTTKKPFISPNINIHKNSKDHVTSTYISVPSRMREKIFIATMSNEDFSCHDFVIFILKCNIPNMYLVLLYSVGKRVSVLSYFLSHRTLNLTYFNRYKHSNVYDLSLLYFHQKGFITQFNIRFKLDKIATVYHQKLNHAAFCCHSNENTSTCISIQHWVENKHMPYKYLFLRA